MCPRANSSGLAHVDQQRICAVELPPVGHRHIAIQHVLGQHTREVDGVFRRTKLRGITQLGFGQIVDGAAKLNRGRDDIDALLHAFQSDRLGTRECGRRELRTAA
jgi:hypothetical protein